ncbi:MAG: hypothetical protein MK188_01575 [Gammaproteobacteria bacterium]|nr:hypothetical protein [Gammaproteobacteria bacterium]
MVFKIFLAATVIALIAWARKATPAGNKQGSSFNTQNLEISETGVLKVASFNIQTGKSNHGVREISASANVLSKVDLAGVQEVYAPSLLNLMGIGKQQTEVLSQAGKFAWVFNATRRRWLREHRGNAVLARIRTLNWRTEMLPDQSGKSYRNMTTCQFEWRGEKFHFINTHLHTRQGRKEQLEIVLREFAKYPRAILVGDFNTPQDAPELEQTLKDVEIIDAISIAKLDSENEQRIDWILTKGFVVEGGARLEKGVSDHPYYEVHLRYKT